MSIYSFQPELKRVNPDHSTKHAFFEANPNTALAEFERIWPKALANFFLTEIRHAVEALTVFSERRDN